MSGFIAPDRAYWEDSWAQSESSPSASRDRHGYLAECRAFDELLARHLPYDRTRRALEIGCYPGGFMVALSKRFGYEVSGFDYVADVTQLRPRLEQEGARVGELIQGDFWSIEPRSEYDVVASYGFLEHFDEPASALARQAGWVAPGGFLVAEVPNLRGFQRPMHRFFDRKSFMVHNLEVMRPDFFRSGLQALGFEILHLGYWRTFQYWYAPDADRGRVARGAVRVLGKVGAVATKLDGEGARLANRYTSPYLVCIAKRPSIERAPADQR